MAKQELVTAILEKTYENEPMRSRTSIDEECKRYLNRQSVEVLTEIYNILSIEA